VELRRRKRGNMMKGIEKQPPVKKIERKEKIENNTEDKIEAFNICLLFVYFLFFLVYDLFYTQLFKIQ